MESMISFLIVGLVAVGIVMLCKHSGVTHPAALTIIVIITVIVTFFVSLPITSCIINNTQWPSRVDVSPMAELSPEHIERIEEVAAQLEFSDFTTSFSIREFEGHPSLSRRYTAGHNCQERPGHRRHLSIEIAVHHGETSAIREMNLERRLRESRGDRYTELVNDNGIEIILRHPFMMTSASGCYAPNSTRTLTTHIRMDNVVIRLWETRHSGDRRDDISSQFITLLAEMLQEE